MSGNLTYEEHCMFFYDKTLQLQKEHKELAEIKKILEDRIAKAEVKDEIPLSL